MTARPTIHSRLPVNSSRSYALLAAQTGAHLLPAIPALRIQRRTGLSFSIAMTFLSPQHSAQDWPSSKRENANVVVCDGLDFYDDGHGHITAGARRLIDWAALEANCELAIATHVWATTAAILYSRSIVEKIGGFRTDLPIIQDARFMFDAAYHGARFARSEHVGARYRIATGSLSRRDPARFAKDLLLNGQQIETLWRARSPLTAAQLQTLMGIYNTAGRALFTAQNPAYFEAVRAQRNLDLTLPLHSRVAPWLAQVMGLRLTTALLSLVGRG